MSESTLADRITAELKRELSYRLYGECLPRIHTCLNKLTEEQIWWRPNAASNSVGNLVLHLAGNVRQWVIAGIGGQQDMRDRNAEFEAQGPMPLRELVIVLDKAMADIRPVIDGVTPAELLQRKPVQVFEETVLTILVHVTEHFSYHTGQIAWITKMLTEQQVGFYEGQDLG